MNQINRPMDTAPRGKYVRIRYANGEIAFSMSLDGWANTGPETPLTPIAWSPIVDPAVDDLIEALRLLLKAVAASAAHSQRGTSVSERYSFGKARAALSHFEGADQ
jgi:hypothetical protein